MSDKSRGSIITSGSGSVSGSASASGSGSKIIIGKSPIPALNLAKATTSFNLAGTWPSPSQSPTQLGKPEVGQFWFKLYWANNTTSLIVPLLPSLSISPPLEGVNVLEAIEERLLVGLLLITL